MSRAMAVTLICTNRACIHRIATAHSSLLNRCRRRAGRNLGPMSIAKTSAAFVDTKPHYAILDGLRGVAAITVVCFHLFEAYATSHLDQEINHGYLAVDFFFILSGFVIGYAYDDRWQTMTAKEFIKRRFIRLHPMVVMFYFQGCSAWDVSKVSAPMLLGATVINACLIPAAPSFEIRGVGEMYPLNGPSWSLFFEYIGNILYAFFIRKLSTKALSVLVIVAGCGLAAFAIWGPYGDICAGFALTEENIIGGSLRLLFSFPAGLLLARVFKPLNVKGAFWIGSLAIIVLLAMPRIGGSEHLWMNGLYDTLCVVIIFPLLVCLGASGKINGRMNVSVCKFLGDISYPLYMVHYPFIYLYYAWVKNEKLTFIQSFPGALVLVVGSLVLAYLCLKLYDEPVRKSLTKRFLRASK
jgi:peptidoglycan/LPS O-acetylase OafA/YrhL